ncbi:MAG: hypothetical protein J6S61_03825 [Elusimicrobiaceae bacterium]|nr:hypothetical protein [Elusimicrobiaceae bacterium]
MYNRICPKLRTQGYFLSQAACSLLNSMKSPDVLDTGAILPICDLNARQQVPAFW